MPHTLYVNGSIDSAPLLFIATKAAVNYRLTLMDLLTTQLVPSRYWIRFNFTHLALSARPIFTNEILTPLC